MVAFLSGPAIAQIGPQRVELEKFTCADLLATQGDTQYRLLLYLDGYVNGLRGLKVWDAQAEGERIDRALLQCKATPSKAALDVFSSVWAR
jgi:hypothetical protein